MSAALKYDITHFPFSESYDGHILAMYLRIAATNLKLSISVRVSCCDISNALVLSL